MSFVLALVCIFLLSYVFVSRRSSFLSLSVCCSFFFLPRAVLEGETERESDRHLHEEDKKQKEVLRDRQGVYFSCTEQMKYIVNTVELLKIQNVHMESRPRVGTFARVVVCNGPARVLNVETKIQERIQEEV